MNKYTEVMKSIVFLTSHEFLDRLLSVKDVSILLTGKNISTYDYLCGVYEILIGKQKVLKGTTVPKIISKM